MNAPLVSILLPTIRPGLFRARMNEFARLDLPGPCEVVVVSDLSELDVSSTHQWLTVRHFTQPRLGTVAAMNLAFEQAEGNYVFATNDESELHPHVFRALIREAAARGDDAFVTVAQTPWCSNDYYDIVFAPCPFGRRSFFQRINGGDWLFDPIYHCFYADPDLAVRAHQQFGISVVVVPDANSTHHNVADADGHAYNSGAYYGIDRDTFVTRWAHLGPPPIDPSLR